MRKAAKVPPIATPVHTTQRSHFAPEPSTSTLKSRGSGGRWQVDRRYRIRF